MLRLELHSGTKALHTTTPPAAQLVGQAAHRLLADFPPYTVIEPHTTDMYPALASPVLIEVLAQCATTPRTKVTCWRLTTRSSVNAHVALKNHSVALGIVVSELVAVPRLTIAKDVDRHMALVA